MITRLAPSPTGALHLGNARTFLLNWRWARARGAGLVMRMEDLDGPRVKPGAAERGLEDLAWLGIDWDGEVLMQSTRSGAHAEALDRLRDRGLVYPCTCTRREIDEARSAPHGEESVPAYPGTCRDRFADETEAREESGRDPAWRFRVPEERIVNFEDVVRGPVSLRPALDSGDFVVARRSGEAAYQLAVVVDDAFQGVTDVVRGDDLVPSTALQILIGEALDLPVPRYHHLPLVAGEDGRRLAKRHGDTRIAHYREEGVPARRVIGLLADWSGDGPRRELTAGAMADPGENWDRVP
ncbi:MAG: tRNA glutamyl-Q(34) synthetase GluQRS, partial [Planctomycetota bacterium]